MDTQPARFKGNSLTSPGRGRIRAGTPTVFSPSSPKLQLLPGPVGRGSRLDLEPSRTGAGVADAVRINIERTRILLDDLPRDHHFLDPFETGEVEHGVQQDAFHDGP